jgi:hypothetical protein
MFSISSHIFTPIWDFILVAFYYHIHPFVCTLETMCRILQASNHVFCCWFNLIQFKSDSLVVLHKLMFMSILILLSVFNATLIHTPHSSLPLRCSCYAFYVWPCVCLCGIFILCWYCVFPSCKFSCSCRSISNNTKE